MKQITSPWIRISCAVFIFSLFPVVIVGGAWIGAGFYWAFNFILGLLW